MGLSKNQIIPLVITGTTAEGSGIGRAETGDESSGMAVIVPFTAVGDRIRCRILKVEKRLAYGRVEELLIPSGDRLPPEEGCPAFGRCGRLRPGGMFPMRRSCGTSSSGSPTPWPV